MKRRALSLGLGSGLVGGLGFSLRAMAQAGVPRIGVLRWGASGDEAQADLLAALADIGYREGQTLIIEWRFARSGDVARQHAKELAALKLDMILASAEA